MKKNANHTVIPAYEPESVNADFLFTPKKPKIYTYISLKYEV